MNKTILVICLIFLTTISNGFAQKSLGPNDKLLEGYEARTYVKEGASFNMPYRLYTPKDAKSGKKFPLVIFMHGAGLAQGTDNISQLIHGAQLFVKPEIQEKYPAFVLAPQCPKEDLWFSYKMPPGTDPAIATELDKYKDRQEQRVVGRKLLNNPMLYFPYDPSTVTKALQMASDLIDEIIAKYPIDKDRIYITGGSMGGFATWGLAYINPGRVAAMAPLCSAGDPSNVSTLVNIPTWIFHGDADDRISVQASRDIVKALKDAGSKVVKYTECPGVPHGGLSTIAYSKDEDKDGMVDLVTWLFAQKRKH